MKRWMAFMFVVVLSSMTAKEVFALGNDFTKEQIAQQGKNCVHGYWVNLTSVVYFAGDATAFNEQVGNLLKASGGEPKDPTYATKKVVLHPGPKKASSPWDKVERNISTDWSVTRWLDSPDAKASPGLQIDIWLGGQIKVEDLRIPAGFEVVSGGEIEKFIENHRRRK